MSTYLENINSELSKYGTIIDKLKEIAKLFYTGHLTISQFGRLSAETGLYESKNVLSINKEFQLWKSLNLPVFTPEDDTAVVLSGVEDKRFVYTLSQTKEGSLHGKMRNAWMKPLDEFTGVSLEFDEKTPNQALVRFTEEFGFMIIGNYLVSKTIHTLACHRIDDTRYALGNFVLAVPIPSDLRYDEVEIYLRGIVNGIPSVDGGFSGFGKFEFFQAHDDFKIDHECPANGIMVMQGSLTDDEFDQIKGLTSGVVSSSLNGETGKGTTDTQGES